MVEFTYFTPTKIIFGPNSEMEVSNLIKQAQGKKILVHFGQDSIKKSGLLKRVLNNLIENDLNYELLGKVSANPMLSKVEEGIALVKAEKIDFVLAIGGGSVIDSAKAIAAGALSDDKVEYLIGKKDINQSLPVGVILTIAAAGSEMSGTSVITNDKTKLKRSFSGDAMRPVFAILNPILTYTLPKYQTACGIADIIMHTVERYFTEAKGLLLTDEIAKVLIQNVINHALIVLNDPTNYQGRAEIMWSGSLSHNDLTSARSHRGDWAVHQMGHEVSAKYNIAHGASLTAIWATWARLVSRDHPKRFLTFATQIMEVNQKDKTDKEIIEAGINHLELFFKEIGLPTSLKDFDFEVSENDINDMTLKASRYNTFKPGTIKQLEYEDIKTIYQNANL